MIQATNARRNSASIPRVLTRYNSYSMFCGCRLQPVFLLLYPRCAITWLWNLSNFNCHTSPWHCASIAKSKRLGSRSRNTLGCYRQYAYDLLSTCGATRCYPERQESSSSIEQENQGGTVRHLARKFRLLEDRGVVEESRLTTHIVSS